MQILVAGMKFFLGKDEDEKNDSGSESEASVGNGVHVHGSWEASLFLWAEGKVVGR